MCLAQNSKKMRIRSKDRWLCHTKLMVLICMIMVIFGTINAVADDDSQNEENGSVD
jgi:t-SNARE complex subunit (syntaxin)